MIGGAYHLLFGQLQSLIHANFFGELLSLDLFVTMFKVTFIVTTYYSNRSLMCSVDEAITFSWGEYPDKRAVTEYRFYLFAKISFFFDSN